MGEDARICWIETAYEIGKEIPMPFSHNKHYIRFGIYIAVLEKMNSAKHGIVPEKVNDL